MKAPNNIEIVHTLDGSDTLYIPELDEHYHSINGAKQESIHVFIKYGLEEIAKNNNIISVLEIGFGTGLNAILTYQYAKDKNLKVSYTALELYPLSQELVSKLHFNDIDKKAFYQIHDAEWNKQIRIDHFFSIEKIHTDFTRTDINSTSADFNLIYFDAFAPDKQPDLWNQNIFDYIYKNTKTNGILTTYCAKGIVRRMMQASGFFVERLPGPPGKREMLRAIKI